MKKTVSAISPWLKIFWFFGNFSIVFPDPAWLRKARASNASFTRSGGVLCMVLVRCHGGSTTLFVTTTGRRGDAGTVIPICRVSDLNRDRGIAIGPFPQGNSPARGGAAGHLASNPYFGGLNSPASQPSKPELMGSRDTAKVSTHPHFWHSNVR